MKLWKFTQESHGYNFMQYNWNVAVACSVGHQQLSFQIMVDVTVWNMAHWKRCSPTMCGHRVFFITLKLLAVMLSMFLRQIYSLKLWALKVMNWNTDRPPCSFNTQLHTFTLFWICFESAAVHLLWLSVSWCKVSSACSEVSNTLNEMWATNA